MGTWFIGSDLSGYTLKEAIKEHVQNLGHTLEDIGTVDTDNPLPFFDVAARGAKTIQDGTHTNGILICGTGMGMSIVANKHEGVHAAACESVYAAEKCRAINDANVLCMGGWIIAPMLGIAMVDTFMKTGFTENLEDWRAERLKKARVAVRELEKDSFNR
ncbi:MAG: RpiB/LacA/LacB family sugar-phosphate isomerase [Acholeplasmatales bacterium]|nr:MAG: RpiB/LacA/LacB family sugar-phosphate isomerase [Acholeplasmatales bacterium]